MKKKSFRPQSKLDQSENSTKFLDFQSFVFDEKGGDIYIGGEKIPENIRSVLRDEAENLKTTRIWEIMNASILNEAYNLALIQSKNFDEVQFAKALKHWSHFMINVIYNLSKK